MLFKGFTQQKLLKNKEKQKKKEEETLVRERGGAGLKVHNSTNLAPLLMFSEISNRFVS